MAKYKLRLEARILREQGVSVKEISKKLKVSKSTASIWTRDIILSISQIEKLRKSSIEGAERGRLKSAFLQKERWIRNIDRYKKLGVRRIGKLGNREFLIAGVALYWAEGSKKSRMVEFCNSDPKMIQFLISWLERYFVIEKKELRCHVGINQIHMKRGKLINKYWAEVTGIPLEQFRGIVYKKTINKKVYANYDNYFGTLTIRVLRPSRFYAKIIGLIEGLAISQRSSGAERTFHKRHVAGSNPAVGTK